MVETRTQAKKRHFKERFSLLFDEFYHLSNVKRIDESLGPQAQAEHPQCFLQIKEKFEQATYDDVAQVVEDMKRITGDIPIAETRESDDARALEFYINRKIEPIVHAEGILELYDTKTKSGELARPRLDENRSLTLGQSDYFVGDFTREEKLKISLSWPLPAVPADTKPNLTARASLSRQTVARTPRLSSALRLPIIPEPTPTTTEGSTSESTFLIEGIEYKVAVIPWRQMLKLSICVVSDNEVDRLSFVSEYVDRFLRSKPIRNDQKGPSELSQEMALSAKSEAQIAEMFLLSLRLPIQGLVLDSLDAYKDSFSDEFNEIISDRPYIFAPGAEAGIQLKAEFSSDQLQSSFFGLSFKPDFKIAYDASVRIGSSPELELEMMPVIFTAIGELKYITFKLGECVEDLKVQRRRRRNRRNEEVLSVEGKQRSRIKEVEDTLFKYTSYCVHLGVPRFALSDYNGYFLAQLEFTPDQPPSGYGTGQAAIEGVRAISLFGKYIKVRYSYFTLDDPYIRLFVASFLAMSKEYVEEMKLFRKLVKTKLQAQRHIAQFQQRQQRAYRQQQRRANQAAAGGTGGGTADTAPGTGGQTGQGSDQAGDRNRRAEEYNLRSTSIFNENSNDTNGIFTPPTSSPRPTPTYHPDVIPLGKESKHGVSQVNSGSQSNRPLTFDKRLFKDPSYVELGNVITDFIAVGPRIAQVVQVQTRNCQRQLFPENMIGDSDLPEKCVMKVYDPYHGVLTEYNAMEGELHSIHYSYQRGIDYAIAEVKVYCALRGCGFTPRLIAYGRISDLYPAVGELYLALCGGYLMLEQLDDDEHFVINKDFYEAKIVPVYQALHLFNILHGDVKRQNVCITEGNFMLIDFSHASFSSDQRKKDAEMLVVKKTFSRVEWG